MTLNKLALTALPPTILVVFKNIGNYGWLLMEVGI